MDPIQRVGWGQWAAEMAQWVKALDAKRGDVSLSPRPHMMEGENQYLDIVLLPPCTCYGRHVPSPQ